MSCHWSVDGDRISGCFLAVGGGYPGSDSELPSGVAMEVVWDLLIFLALVAVGLVVLRVLSDSR